jgi:hypothetical protein
MGEQVRALLAEGRADAELFAALQAEETEHWPELLASAIDEVTIEALDQHEGTRQIRDFIRLADRWLVGYVREARLVAFGPERVFGCMVGLEAESLNLALSVVGWANEVEPERLLDCLRASYVPGGG